MKTNVTLEQALSRASKRLKEKIMYSVELLRKAEKLALAYGGGVIMAITLPLVQERTVRHSIMLQSWQE